MSNSLEEMKKKLAEENSELIKQIEKNTTHLQHIDLDGGRIFKSYVVKGLTDLEDVYCSVDTVNMEDSISDMLQVIEDDNIKSMFESIRGTMNMRVAFTVTVSKSHTSIRVVRGDEIVATMEYSNVKSVDDFMKLVSFHTSEFVDPMLKDYDTIKEILGK